MKLQLILLLLALTTQARANSEQDAMNKAAEAAYIQSGIKDNVERFSKDFERRYIPVFIIDNGGIVMFIAETFYRDEVRLKYTWRF